MTDENTNNIVTGSSNSIEDKLMGIIKANKTLFNNFRKMLRKNCFTRYSNPVQGLTYEEQDVANYNTYLRTLLCSVKGKQFDKFIRFFRENPELCKKIKEKVDKMGGFEEKNSYIIISRNKDILNIMKSWAFLSIIKPEGEHTTWNYTYVGYEVFEFLEMVKLLERKPYQIPNDDDDDPLDSEKMYMSDVYFDIIWNNIGYLYDEKEAIKVYGKVNNRMIELMQKGRRGTIILSTVPIPIFEQQIQNGVENFHILDLRDIENITEEVVEME